MTEGEARAELARLEREDADRERYDFLTREEADGEWSVVRVKLPEGVRKAGKTGTATEPPPDPPAGPDSDQRSRPFWAPGV